MREAGTAAAVFWEAGKRKREAEGRSRVGD